METTKLYGIVGCVWPSCQCHLWVLLLSSLFLSFDDSELQSCEHKITSMLRKSEMK